MEETVARQGGPGAWVSIAGDDQRALGRHPAAAELDPVSHGRKVFMLHDSGHGCVVNTGVLDLLPADVPHENDTSVLCGQSAYNPATSVSITSCSAPRATAGADAARSALTL